MSGEVELIVTGGHTADGSRCDIAIADGVIVQLAPRMDREGSARQIDADGLLVLPGGVDPHVHFNEPGPRTGWEGWATGTAALAAGGMTSCVEMPLNASPPTTTAAAFDAKLAAAKGTARIDFGLWGGVVPGNAGELEALATRGVVGFKAFMSSSGVEDFPASDRTVLREAMATIAALPDPLPLAVHAESETITQRRARAARAAGASSVRDYLDSRPVAAETEAVAEAIELAAATGCPLHVVHVSSGEGVALVTRARARGVDVTCEVTAHHLVLTEDDAIALGAIAKCAPPLRPAAQTAALWDALGRGEAAFAVSDHSPSPPGLKAGDAFAAWGGIAGGQATLELLVSEAGRRIEPAALPRVLAGGAARRLGLAGKGELTVGADGDLALVDTRCPRVLAAGELRDRHRLSPYVGRTVHARVVATILRGQVIAQDGEPCGEPRGRLLRPQNPSR